MIITIARQCGCGAIRVGKLLAEKYGIPLIGWTVRDKTTQQYAESFCDNVIIEGAESYI